MSAKYTLTSTKKSHFLVDYYQIKALKDFTRKDGVKIKAGDLGAFVQSELNLAQNGSCWADEKSLICGKAKISDDALILNSTIKEKAQISGKVLVKNSHILDEAKISDECEIINSRIYDEASVAKKAQILDSIIYGETKISGEVKIINSSISDEAVIKDKVIIENNCNIGGDCVISGNAHIKNHLFIQEFDKIHIEKGVFDFSEFLVFENDEPKPILLNKNTLKFYENAKKAIKYLKSQKIEAKFNLSRTEFGYEFELLIILPDGVKIKVDKTSIENLAKG